MLRIMTMNLRWVEGGRVAVWGERLGRARVDGVKMVSCLYMGSAAADQMVEPNYPPSDYHGGPGYLPSRASTPTFEGSNAGHRPRDPYPAWTVDANIPLSKEEIEDVLIDLANKFGFQKDSSRNVYDFLMIQLDSRASRMSPNQALLTLHADYIGGEHANYRKWYFAAQLDLDDAIGAVQNPGLNRVRSVARRGGKTKNPLATAQEKSLESATSRWRTAMNNMSQYDRLRQVALYLLCWGEAAQVRFMPECLCFIFKCADDYYRSPECQNRQEAVPEGLYLRAVIKPLYRFLRDQGYEVVDGKFLRRERDHDKVIGYDDVNQLFWYPEGISRITLNDNVGTFASCSSYTDFPSRPDLSIFHLLSDS